MFILKKGTYMAVLCHIPHYHVLLSDVRRITVYDDAQEVPKCACVVTIEL